MIAQLRASTARVVQSFEQLGDALIAAMRAMDSRSLCKLARMRDRLCEISHEISLSASPPLVGIDQGELRAQPWRSTGVLAGRVLAPGAKPSRRQAAAMRGRAGRPRASRRVWNSPR